MDAIKAWIKFLVGLTSAALVWYVENFLLRIRMVHVYMFIGMFLLTGAFFAVIEGMKTSTENSAKYNKMLTEYSKECGKKKGVVVEGRKLEDPYSTWLFCIESKIIVIDTENLPK